MCCRLYTHTHARCSSDTRLDSDVPPLMPKNFLLSVCFLLFCILRDLYSSLDRSSVDAVFASHQASLSQAKFSLEYPHVQVDEPMSDILYPIIPSMAMNGNSNLDILLLSKSVVTGILSMSFYWRHYLLDLLPPTFDGLILVFENKCSKNVTSTTNSSSASSFSSFTYQINGPSAQFLGVGDQHETQFNDMEQLAWPMMKSSSGENVNDADTAAAYIGIPVNEDHCPFSVRVYPSQVMKSRYTTHSPITLTMASILVFVLTSALFIVYDCWVERRQRKILQKAVHSIAIVSSLFPSVVRDRIFPFASSSSPTSPPSSRTLGENVAAEDTPRKRLKGIMRRCSLGGSTDSSQKQQDMGIVNDYSKPVAELFPDSTVLFSDIAGFTAWR